MIQSRPFLDFVHNAPGITPEEERKVLDCFKELTLKSKEYFLKEGEICNRIAYVHKGCLSFYHLFDNGRKSIIQFAFEDWWIGDLESFLNKKPSANFWQALEDVELIYIYRSDFEKMMSASESFRSLFTTKTQTAYSKALERSAKDRSESAEQRYLRMINESPQIIARVPHYDVAAYLGMTPESLSRIRNRLARKK